MTARDQVWWLCCGAQITVMVRSRRGCGEKPSALAAQNQFPCLSKRFRTILSSRLPRACRAHCKLVKRWFALVCSHSWKRVLTSGGPPSRRRAMALNLYRSQSHTCPLHLSSTLVSTHSRRRVTRGVPPPRQPTTKPLNSAPRCFYRVPCQLLMLAPCLVIIVTP